MVVSRLDAGGTPDAGFGSGGSAIIDFDTPGQRRTDFGTSVAVLADGRIVVGGQSLVPDGSVRAFAFALARLTSEGVLDPTFGTGGKVLTQMPLGGVPRESVLRSLVARPDGTVIAGGTVYTAINIGQKATTPSSGTPRPAPSTQPSAAVGSPRSVPRMN
jgi:uncharacterized delta-60 repeat protein